MSLEAALDAMIKDATSIADVAKEIPDQCTEIETVLLQNGSKEFGILGWESVCGEYGKAATHAKSLAQGCVKQLSNAGAALVEIVIDFRTDDEQAEMNFKGRWEWDF